MVDTFVKQLDGCSYLVNGVPSGGFNCTCAAHAMWLFRASGGKIKITSCFCRMLTGDRSGGTHLGQMEAVSKRYGITDGRVYRPISTTTLKQLAATKRYGFHLNVHYSVISGGIYDCFKNRFHGNHDFYISGPGTKAGTWRAADPGADGRAPGIHTGFADYPIDLLLRAAAALDVSDPDEPYRALGSGRAYVYLTPPDPIPPSNHYRATISKPTALWNDLSQRWVYSTDKIDDGQVIEVRGKQFPKGGVATYPVTTGPCSNGDVRQVDGDVINIAGYYVPVKSVILGGRCG